VLAAGRGERLRPLTEELPKPLVPVAGRPLVAWTLERLARAGVEGAALNLHHLGERIRSELGDEFRAGRRALPLRYSEEPVLLGTGGALPPLAAWLGAAEQVVVVNGDSLCRWPLVDLVQRARRGEARATLLVHRSADPRRFGGGVAVEDGRVVAFRPGALAARAARVRRVFAGAAVLAPELIERLPPGPSDIVAALYEPMLARGEPIAAVETARPWFDLGTPERYLEAALAWALAGRARGDARVAASARVEPGVRLRRTVVERDSELGRDARLAGCLVLDGARVGAGCRLTGSIVAPGARVPAGEAAAGLLWPRSGPPVPIAVEPTAPDRP
jgi:NDP-sugar pyrophosphorylase family protein